MSKETLRTWLVEAGLWQARRRGSPHRAWRERRAHWGELVQMDGSEHDWFEGRRDKASLMVMIDDATNWTHAKFFESETTAAAMTVFWEYVGYYGLPRALYVDRDSIYETTRALLVGRVNATRFVRSSAMKAYNLASTPCSMVSARNDGRSDSSGYSSNAFGGKL